MNYKSILLISLLLLFVSGCSSASHKNKEITFSKVTTVNADGSYTITETKHTKELNVKLDRIFSITAIEGFDAILADGSSYGVTKSTIDPDEAAIDSAMTGADNITATVMTGGAANVVNNMQNKKNTTNETNDITTTIMSGNASDIVDIIKNKENN